MRFTKTNSKLLAVAGIVTSTLLDAAPSKAILYIDFIPLSPTSTRIQASGTLNPSLLGTSSSPSPIQTNPSGTSTSGITRSVQDQLRFTYSSSIVSAPARLFAITGPNNPFTQTGVFQAWAGTTPTNTPPFILQLGTTKGIRLANTFSGGTTPINQVKPLNGFFDVNLSLAQIGLSSRIIAYTSGSEQIILRDATPTPGPVPLLGAAAAFGYSRKLRNRIQKSTLKPIA